MLTHCDLFAGIGGFAIAAMQLNIQTTQFVEIDIYAQKVLKHHFPNIPIKDDVRTYYPTLGEFDLVTCGFPCTSTSVAGRREGIHGRESNLWWEAWRIVRTVRPRFVVVENPTGLLARGFNEVVSSLGEIGYVGEWFCVRASALGAGHRRDRLFVVSYPDQQRSDPKPHCRAEQMRALVQGQRTAATWGTVERSSDGEHYGLSSQLVRSGFATPTNYPGRIKARVLAGRTVCPAQAAIALNRVLQIQADLENANNEPEPSIDFESLSNK
jgi:DNA (cytosine-5)-methyltransferase 1